MAVSLALEREWKILVESSITSLYDIKCCMLLLSAFEKNLPYTICGFDDESIVSQVLIKSFVLYYNLLDKTIGSYYGSLNIKKLKLLIKPADTMNTKLSDKGGFSDDERCIGLCYEFAAVRTLCCLSINYQNFKDSEATKQILNFHLDVNIASRCIDRKFAKKSAFGVGNGTTRNFVHNIKILTNCFEEFLSCRHCDSSDDANIVTLPRRK